MTVTGVQTCALPISWDTHVPGAINAGVSGNETGQMLARFDADVLAHDPAVLVLLGGTNDIRNRDSADPEKLFEIVSRAKAADIRRSEERRVGNDCDWSSDVCSSDLMGHSRTWRDQRWRERQRDRSDAGAIRCGRARARPCSSRPARWHE